MWSSFFKVWELNGEITHRGFSPYCQRPERRVKTFIHSSNEEDAKADSEQDPEMMEKL